MATTDPRDALEAGAKQWLADLDDDAFAELVTEVRSDAPTGKPAGDTGAGAGAADKPSAAQMKDFLRKINSKG